MGVNRPPRLLFQMLSSASISCPSPAPLNISCDTLESPFIHVQRLLFTHEKSLLEAKKTTKTSGQVGDFWETICGICLEMLTQVASCYCLFWARVVAMAKATHREENRANRRFLQLQRNILICSWLSTSIRNTWATNDGIRLIVVFLSLLIASSRPTFD